jgi:hypothetical protein
LSKQYHKLTLLSGIKCTAQIYHTVQGRIHDFNFRGGAQRVRPPGSAPAVRTVPKYYRKILKKATSIPITHIYMTAHFPGLIPTLLLKRNVRGILVLWAYIFPFCDLWIQLVLVLDSTIPIIIYFTCLRTTWTVNI